MKITAGRRRCPAWLAVALVLAAGCSSCAAGPGAPPSSAPIATHQRTAPGGCAATRALVGDLPPAWALAGFSASGLGGVPWAMGSPPNAVAFLFASQLVAGGNRPDGSSNKILWVTRDPPSNLTIVGRPLGSSQPLVTVAGQLVSGNQLPTIVDVPAAGCWSFEISWTHGRRQTSHIDLNVLPAGTQPPYT